MIDIYYIGGSPCSGKSTVAEVISQKYNLYYFKVDDFLDKYTEMGAEKGKPICSKQKSMTPDQIWMRNPMELKNEEVQFYGEIFEFIMDDIKSVEGKNRIITEGAAFLPSLMQICNIDRKHYVNITSTPEFQISHYKERPWVSYVLEGCSDKEKAFINWMNRDILFADEVREQCKQMGDRMDMNPMPAKYFQS